MEKTTKRIILSIVTLVLVVVALGTTTFAWFTLSNVATVGNIDGTVMGGDGLQVAYGLGDTVHTQYRSVTSDDDWDELFTKIKDSKDEALKFNTFGAISSKNGIDFFGVAINEAGNTLVKTAKLNSNEDKGYLEFTVHFKSQAAGTVFLTGYDFIEESGGTHFVPDVAYTQTTEELKGTVVELPQDKTVRSFVPQAINGLRVAVADDTEVKAVLQNGASDGNEVMGAKGITAGQFSYLEAKGLSVNWGEILIPTSVEIYEASSSIAEGGVSVVTLAETPEESGEFTGKATIRVWIEGWDADTYDSIFNLPFAFNLTFEKKE